MLPRLPFICCLLTFFQVWASTMVHGCTWFDVPLKYTSYQPGDMVMIRLVSDTHDTPIGGTIQLLDQNGFLPRDLGKIGLVNHTSSVVETATDGTNRMTSTYSFKLWDQLADGNRYQLAFLPYSAAHGSNAFSHYFAVAKRR